MTSPYEPPSGAADLAAQVDDLDVRMAVAVGEHVTATADAGPDAQRYPYRIEHGGVVVWARRPRPEALHAFSMAVSKHSKTETQTDMVTLFVQSHVAAASYELLLEQLMDPDGTFTTDDLGGVMRDIATLGTARPTAP